MIYKPATTTGFTLVEVLVAITILLLVITGPMQIMTRANNSTAYSSEQVIAFFLAQEGLELAQKGRDDLMLADFRDEFGGPGATDPWAQFRTDFTTCLNVTGCGLAWNMDTTPDSIAAPLNCATPDSCRLNVREAGTTNRDRYTYASVSPGITPSKYTRTIRMERVTGGAGGRDRGMTVTSTVTWRTGSLIAGQQVELSTYLANVYDKP